MEVELRSSVASAVSTNTSISTLFRVYHEYPLVSIHGERPEEVRKFPVLEIDTTR